MHLLRWLLTLVFCISTLAILGFIKFTQVKAAIAFGESFPEPSETVEVRLVETSQWQPMLNVNGEVLATRSVAVRNELEGMITEVGFASGGAVSKGDILIQLDVTDELAQLDAIKAEQRIAQLDVNRFTQLLKSNASSRDQIDRAKAQLAVAKARSRSLMFNITKKTLVAPFDSVAGLHQLEVGAFLPANTVVTRLISSKDEVWVDFSVPQEFARLTVGDIVTVSSDSLLSEPAQAVIVAISQEIQSDSRNLRARSLWKNVPTWIKPGAFLDVSLPIGNTLNIVRLPSVAIRYDAFGPHVYQLNKDDKNQWRAKRVAVEVEANSDKTTIITSELTVGSTIATIGSSKLSEGILVNVAQSKVDE
jgi:membrane fusion protein (multidrug efflux system)